MISKNAPEIKKPFGCSQTAVKESDGGRSAGLENYEIMLLFS